MAQTIVDDELWESFHTVVNMTSRELRDWLAVQATTDVLATTVEETPERADTDQLGARVLDVLAKRRSDVTPDDVEVMEQVVELVLAERPEPELEPTAGEDAWRRRLMNVGHDPLKPVD